MIELLGRAFEYDRIEARRWYVPVVLLPPTVAITTYGLMGLLGLPRPAQLLSVPTALAMFLVFFVLAIGEEVGWSGYVTDPLQERWNALTAGTVLGVVWAGLHVIPMVQVDQSAAFIAWACLDMIGIRILLVWLYNNAGKSVFAVVLSHSLLNLSTKSLFPGGSYHAERILTLIVFVVIVIAFLGQFLSPIVSQPAIERVSLANTYGLAGLGMVLLAVAFVIGNRWYELGPHGALRPSSRSQ